MAEDVLREITAILAAHYLDPTRLPGWVAHCERLNTGSFGAENITASVINRGLSELGLSHTRRYTPDEIDYYHLLDTYREIRGFRRASDPMLPQGAAYTGIGITVTADAANRFFVAGVMPRSPADRAGLVPGDELLAVNGDRYSPVASLTPFTDLSVTLRFRRERGGNVIECPVTPRRYRPSRLLARATRDSASIIPVDDKPIGYVKAWSLAGEGQCRSVTSAVALKLGSAKALVLDLRGGIGGASPEFADYFLGRSPELRVRDPRTGYESIVNRRWRKPVIVLADESTKSGSEILVFALKAAGSPIVGQRTAGAVTAAKPFLLSDRSFLLVAAKQVTVDGIILEGNGVGPTVSVPREIPYSAGEDQPLREAFRIASHS